MSGAEERYRQVRMWKGGFFIDGWVTAAMATRGRRVSVDGYTGVWTIREVWGSKARSELVVEQSAARDVADVLEPHA